MCLANIDVLFALLFVHCVTSLPSSVVQDADKVRGARQEALQVLELMELGGRVVAQSNDVRRLEYNGFCQNC